MQGRSFIISAGDEFTEIHRLIEIPHTPVTRQLDPVPESRQYTFISRQKQLFYIANLK